MTEKPSYEDLEQSVRELETEVFELRHTNEGLRERERRFRQLFENSRDGFVMVGADGSIIDANPAYCDMLGYSLDELRALENFYCITPERWRDWEATEIWEKRLLGHGYSGLYEKEYIRKDGTIFPVELRSYAVRRVDGAVEYLWGTARDITERKQAEESREKLQSQLLQAQKMESVGRLAGGVAHDFNNMLAVILGQTEMALMEKGTTESLHRKMLKIQESAERSAVLVRQLLAFARKQTIAPVVLKFNDTVAGMLNMLHRLIGEDIQLAWIPGPDLWPVKMDPSQIDQVLANLCLNARDAIADVGKITIETQNVVLDSDYCAHRAGFVPGEYVMLVVSDNGCGMENEVRQKLFDPFFTTKGVGKGTGLGLATVYGIVRQNKGFINVYSEPGQGTTFKIYLPRHAGDAGHTTGMDLNRPIQGGQETVMIVEDEPMLLEIGKSMVEKLGYRVLAANTPEEAMRELDAHAGEIHLLMTDVILPGMNGRDLAGRLRALYPNLRCLFMSGYTADVIAHCGVLNPGVHFMQKPFTLQTLSAKLREVLEQE